MVSFPSPASLCLSAMEQDAAGQTKGPVSTRDTRKDSRSVREHLLGQCGSGMVRSGKQARQLPQFLSFAAGDAPGARV